MNPLFALCSKLYYTKITCMQAEFHDGKRFIAVKDMSEVSVLVKVQQPTEDKKAGSYKGRTPCPKLGRRPHHYG